MWEGQNGPRVVTNRADAGGAGRADKLLRRYPLVTFPKLIPGLAFKNSEGAVKALKIEHDRREVSKNRSAEIRPGIPILRQGK